MAVMQGPGQGHHVVRPQGLWGLQLLCLGAQGSVSSQERFYGALGSCCRPPAGLSWLLRDPDALPRVQCHSSIQLFYQYWERVTQPPPPAMDLSPHSLGQMVSSTF